MATLLKKPAAKPALEGVNFGSLSDYSAGGIIPEGDYLLSDFTVMMWQAEKKDGTKVGNPVLAVRVTHEPPQGATKEEEQKFGYYSMGREAHLSYAPNPETGKGLVAVAGGKGGGLNDQTNWAIYLQNLYDSGLPEGVFTNDMTVLDGMQVHCRAIPEPESRKTMNNARTGEVAGEPRQPKTITVVSEIKGCSWEGTAGPIEAAPAKTAAPPKPSLLKKKLAPPPPPPVEEASNEEAEQIFAGALEAVMQKNLKGMSRMQLRTALFRTLKEGAGEDVANALTEAYFATDEPITAALNTIGFTIQGANVVLMP